MGAPAETLPPLVERRERLGRVAGVPDRDVGRPGRRSRPRVALPRRRARARGLNAAALFAQTVRIRAFEEALAGLWERGAISGEMHLGIGEEALAAGVLAHVADGDGLAVDHRSTPPLVARGVDLESLTLEMLGSEQGLCRGRGGHMHLFSPGFLASSSGIVGAAGPTACGFALAAQLLRPGAVGVAFFGEGAANQGMLLESLNLAVAWRLPVVFVCKDNRWAITTRSRRVTGGKLASRARAFGMPATSVDGTRVEAVWRAAGRAFARARAGRGPSFVLASCPRIHGHFLGDPLLGIVEHPRREAAAHSGPLTAALREPIGAPGRRRVAALGRIATAVGAAGVERYLLHRDPVRRARGLLSEPAARAIEAEARAEVGVAVEAALARAEGGRTWRI